jgi:twitching motility protein PilT
MESQVLEALLETGVRHGASDIHFRPGAPPMYRVNKQLVPLKTDALTPDGCAAIARAVGGRRFQKMQLEDVQEYDTSYSIPGVARFRVNIYRQRGTISLVLRIVPTKVPTIKALGIPQVIQKIAENERGLVLVTGATGSGKSTTLASMINHINETRMDHVLTIEDPIEFVHKNIKASVSQREIGPDTASFAHGLRAALRQDPDVILVGEMRDTDSIDIALKAAETGHLVFSTVHTTDAAKTIGRIISVFAPEQQQIIRMRLAENLQATISQRLLPRADGQGMVVACEIMLCTQAIREVIADPSSGNIKDLIEQGRQHYHMQSFDQHLVHLFKNGVITKQTAMRAATSPGDFERNLEFT